MGKVGRTNMNEKYEGGEWVFFCPVCKKISENANEVYNEEVIYSVWVDSEGNKQYEIKDRDGIDFIFLCLDCGDILGTEWGYIAENCAVYILPDGTYKLHKEFDKNLNKKEVEKAVKEYLKSKNKKE